MKVYRYMSKNEFQLLTSGAALQNHTEHKAKTNSVGFCFLAEQVKIRDAGETFYTDPLDCYQFLSGIVSDDMLVEFEADPSLFQSSYGVYSSLLRGGFFDTCVAEELCLQEYSQETLKPIRYTTDFYDPDGDWHDIARG